MDHISTDGLHTVLRYLTNDVRAICHFESTCSYNLQAVRNFPALFQDVLVQHWTTGTLQDNNSNITMNPRDLVRERCIIDGKALARIRIIASSLREEVGEDATSMNGFEQVGNSWDHPLWRLLLEMGPLIHDVLRSIANENIDNDMDPAEVFEQKLQRFLSATALVSMHRLECLYEWQSIHVSQTRLPVSTSQRNIDNERFALLAVKAHLTPPELLKETTHTEVAVRNQLDEIAETCRDEVNESRHILDKLQTLFQELGFQDDNERHSFGAQTSLLNHVLERKMGNSVGTTILYACICRRLDVKVDIMHGLPFLGFYDSVLGKQRLLDVSQGGSVLELDNPLIASSFAWHIDSVQRPRDPHQVFQLILESAFPVLRRHESASIIHTSLVLLLSSVNRQPAVLEDVLTQVLQHLSLSVELLNPYGLLLELPH